MADTGPSTRPTDSKDAQIILRGTRSLGYGFVTFGSQDDATKAVGAIDKTDIGGRQVNVEIAKPPPVRPRLTSTSFEKTREAEHEDRVLREDLFPRLRPAPPRRPPPKATPRSARPRPPPPPRCEQPGVSIPSEPD